MNYKELLSMAGGDEQVAQAVLANLRRLRDGAGDRDLQELARDVLEGRITLRQVARSEAYGKTLSQRFREAASALRIHARETENY